MIPDYPLWASGPETLQRLGAVVAQARVCLACLCEMPVDSELRRDLVRLTGALVAHADREGWPALGGLAGPLVRVLATRRSDGSAFDALEVGFVEIEALIDERMARA